MSKLLTPEQVAEILQISVRTVYENRKRLGGFYPFGIRVLRFREEVINGSVVGQGKEYLALRVPVQGAASYGIGGNKGRRKNRKGKPQEKGNGGFGEEDPNRHGLFNPR